MPGHFRTTKVWLPKRLSCFSMSLCITRMAVITTMIENTPTKTPSNVSPERSLWAASAPMAIRKLSRSSASSIVVRFVLIQNLPRPRGEKRKNGNRNTIQTNAPLASCGSPIAHLPRLLIPQRIHRIHPRRAPGGEESRQHTGHQRNQQRNAYDDRRHRRRHHLLY